MKTVRVLRIVLVLAVFTSGCRGPTSEDRNNQRVVEEILTAITLKNPRLLEEAAKRAAARHDAGQYTDDEYLSLDAIIKKARGRDWPGAEKDAYDFRKQHRFVKWGQ